MQSMGTMLWSRVRVLLAVCVLGVFGMAGVARAATFTVNDQNDASLTPSTSNTCQSTDPGPHNCTLRAAVQAADNNGGANTITLPSGTYTLTIPSTDGNDPSTGDLDVVNTNTSTGGVQVTINGAGASSTTINANHIDRAFAIDACSAPPGCTNALSISGVTVENGQTTYSAPSDNSTDADNGGAFYNDGILSINSSTLTGNSAYEDGGVVYTDTGASSTSITNSTVTQNSAVSPGGVAYVNTGPVTLTGDQITHNSADDEGGVLYMDEDGYSEGALDASDTTMSDNTADDEGGALALEYMGAIALSNSTLSGNDADDEGGAIYSYETGPMNISGSTLSGNSADDEGGAIYEQSSGLLTISGSTFDSDAGDDDDGGAIATDDTDLSLSSSTFNDDTGCCGGALYIDGTSSTAAETITTTSFSNNHAESDEGGAIYDDYGDLQISQSSFADNGSTYYGGALYYDSGDGLSLTNDTFDGNQSAYYGGGIYFDESASTGTIDLLNDTIARNTSYEGGGIYDPADANSITNTIVADNSASTSSDGSGDCYESSPTDNAGAADQGGNIDSDGSCFSDAVVNDKTGVNPLLGPLADNGGPTETDALLAGSPAIGDAIAADCPATDQRGVPRSHVQGQCDSGAFQTAPAPLTVSKSAPSSAGTGQAFNYTITVSNGGPGFSTGTTLSDQLPAGETLYGATPSQGSCSSSGSPALVSCSLGNIASGSNATVTMVVAEANAGSVTNTAVAANSEGAKASGSATTKVSAPVAPAGATAPTAITNPASKVNKSTATLNGEVVPGGQPTGYFYQYGTTTSYGEATPVAHTGTSTAFVPTVISRLSRGTRYHFRLVAINDSGSSFGRDREFKTSGKNAFALDSKVLSVKNGEVYVPFTCKSTSPCNGNFSIVTHAIVTNAKLAGARAAAATDSQATVVCTKSKSTFFRIKAGKRKLVHAGVSAGCLALLDASPNHKITAKLSSRPRTGQHGLIKIVTLVLK